MKNVNAEVIEYNGVEYYVIAQSNEYVYAGTVKDSIDIAVFKRTFENNEEYLEKLGGSELTKALVKFDKNFNN